MVTVRGSVGYQTWNVMEMGKTSLARMSFVPDTARVVAFTRMVALTAPLVSLPFRYTWMHHGLTLRTRLLPLVHDNWR